jgi:hypothetical protein
MDAALDYIILSKDEILFKNIIWNAPINVLEAIDNRCKQIENTKQYKKRFRQSKHSVK